MLAFEKTLMTVYFSNENKELAPLFIDGKIEQQRDGSFYVIVNGELVAKYGNYNDAVQFVKENYK